MSEPLPQDLDEKPLRIETRSSTSVEADKFLDSI